MPELDVAATLLYYVYLALGSVSVGYFLVRFAYPDVRLFSSEEKLGASALVGLFIAIISISADVLSSGVPTVLGAKGFVLPFWLAASVGIFAILKVSLREKHAEVAIPVTSKLKVLQHELEDLQEKPPEKQSDISKKLNELRKKGVIPRAGVEQEIIKRITPSPPPVEVKPVVSEQALPASPPIGKLEQNVREAKRVLEKAKETEIELILSDLNVRSDRLQRSQRHIPHAQAPPSGLLEEGKPVQEIKETPEEPSLHPRRLYLQKQAPQKKEEKREEKKFVAPKQEKPVGVQPVTMEDLFGPAPASTGKPKEVSVVSSAQAPEICPNCHTKNSRIVFCPYCGTGMCANCSPVVIPSAEGFTYQCPKCGEEIPVNRKPVSGL